MKTFPRVMQTALQAVPLVVATAFVSSVGCGSGDSGATPSSGSSVAQLMQARDLKDEDVVAALKTYTPTGTLDEHLLIASGGHSGHLVVIGVPSMRILKYVGVFTPEPWQGYGFDDDTKKMLSESSPEGRSLTWGDVHHPALSETDGEYDGEFVFVNDKANARVAVINLKDFTTSQIVRSGILKSDHGSTFVTPNTEYILEGGQYPAPLDGSYAELDDYDSAYRSAAVFWKFDRKQGRIIRDDSFAVELPPYMQDIADMGKKQSNGWAFINSFDTERSHGGNSAGKPPLESGASQNDMDYLHMIHWQKAAEVAAAEGKTKTIQQMRVIPLETAVKEGVLYFVPEPKSPHGVDVSPDGGSICISGKLDTHETVYDFAQMEKLIEEERFEGKDPYGVPILPFKESIRGQVEVGLGPLHTQFDDKGYAYTSLFIASQVAKWSLKDLELIETLPVHYNVGHICALEGDTAKPGGKYLVSLNKWSIDRFTNVGPLLPQNFQLIDISGDKMQLLYDLPIPLGEPHYAQMIPAKKVKAWEMYSPVGMNQVTHETDPAATTSEKKARVERDGNTVDAYLTLVRSHLTPDVIRVKQGDTVRLHLTNIEQTQDATHGFAIDDYNINVSMEPGKEANVTFQAEQSGVFPYYCTEFCSALHLEMAGYLLVEPKKE